MEMSNNFEEGSILNVTFLNQNFLIVKSQRRQILNYPTAVEMVKSGLHRVHIIDKNNFVLLDTIPVGRELPNIFKEGTVLRCKTCREIFIVMGEKRHSIPSMEAFIHLGKDLDQV